MHFQTKQHEQTHYRPYKQGDQSCPTPSKGSVGLQSTSVVQRKSEQPSPFLHGTFPNPVSGGYDALASFLHTALN